MAELFNITHDANNLNEYDSTVTDGGDLSTSTPGLAGTTAKMQVLIDDTTAIYGDKNSAPSTNKLRFRFYFDINSLTMATGDVFYIFAWRLSVAPSYLVQARIYRTESAYHIKVMAEQDDSSTQDIGYSNFTDALHYFEISLTRASGAGNDDGTVDLWIDKVFQGSSAAVDNYNLWANILLARIGAISSLDAGTSGTIYLDEFKANDDGSEIGPVSPPTGAALPILAAGAIHSLVFGGVTVR